MNILRPVLLGLALFGFSGQVQTRRSAAEIVLAETAISVNDATIESDALPSVLPDPALVRATAGRAVVGLKRGGWLMLDAGSSARIIGNGVYNFNHIEVVSGRAIVVSDTSAPLVRCRSEIRLSTAGLFRFDALEPNARGERFCQFRVYEGASAIPLTSLTSALRPGEMMTCPCGDMIPVMNFTPVPIDAFDEWARKTRAQLK